LVHLWLQIFAEAGLNGLRQFYQFVYARRKRGKIPIVFRAVLTPGEPQ
jgi:hypothetical protein